MFIVMQSKFLKQTLGHLVLLETRRFMSQLLQWMIIRLLNLG